jgi:hypothetical protein
LPIVGNRPGKVESMDFVFTDSFYATYESLSDGDVAIVDDAIRRLLQEHTGGWARQGRIDGELGGPWIVSLRSKSMDASLYWDYLDEDMIVLLALVVREA